MSAEEIDKAFSDMSAEPLEEFEAQTTPRKRAWQRSQANHRERLAKAAKIAGYPTIGELAKAIISGTAKVIKQ